MRQIRSANRPSRSQRRLTAAALLAVAVGGCALPASNAPVPDSIAQVQVPPVRIAVPPAPTAVRADTAQSPREPNVRGSETMLVSAAEPLSIQEEDIPPGDELDSATEDALENAQENETESEPARTEQPPERSRSAEDFVALALAGHPSIRAARQRVAAASHRITLEGALPDPMLNNTFWPLHDQALQTAGGRVGNQMSLSQAVPWPEKRRTRSAIAAREVGMAQAELERVQREVAESVKLAYYELWYATRALAIVEETEDLVSDLTQVAEARYRSGGTQQDVLRAQLEEDRLVDQIVSLRQQKEIAQANLAALVQQPTTLVPEAQNELGLTDVPQQLDQLVADAERCNPELKSLLWEIQRDRQRQRLACLQKYPDLQFGVNWGLISDNSNVLSKVADGHDNISFTVGTSLPIWQNKIRAGIGEAAHRTSSTIQRLEAERDSLYGELRRLLAQADALVEQREIYQERMIPRTEAMLKVAIVDYRGNRTDFFTLIETYRELLMFEMQLARTEANLAGTVAQLERAVGCPLQ